VIRAPSFPLDNDSTARSFDTLPEEPKMISPATKRSPLARLLLCGLAAATACNSREGKGDIAHSTESAAATSDGRHHNSACALVTRGEMEDILGSPVEAPHVGDDGDEASCAYPVPGGLSAVQISVDWSGGVSGWQGVKLGRELLDKTAAGMGLGQFNEPVAGLGDEAFVQSVRMPKIEVRGSSPLDLSSLGGGQGVLWVKKGDAVMSITVANQENAKEKATAVARKALARM
jgi:hypothetical protein